MAGGVALSELLLEKHYNVPKSNDVSRIIRTLIHDVQIMPEDKASKLEDRPERFDHLATVGGDAGYSCESSIDLEIFRKIYNYAESIQELIDFTSNILVGLE